MNAIVWNEIYVQDMERAKRFYETVFKFKLQKLESPGDEFEMWAFPMEMNQAGASGALVKMEGVPAPVGLGTVPYFHCDEVNTELGRVKSAGGKIFKPKMSIGQYGSIALVYDTEGNMIGLHMPAGT
jgi:uncharacterized protein